MAAPLSRLAKAPRRVVLRKKIRASLPFAVRLKSQLRLRCRHPRLHGEAAGGVPTFVIGPKVCFSQPHWCGYSRTTRFCAPVLPDAASGERARARLCFRPHYGRCECLHLIFPACAEVRFPFYKAKVTSAKMSLFMVVRDGRTRERISAKPWMSRAGLSKPPHDTKEPHALVRHISIERDAGLQHRAQVSCEPS